VTSALRVMTYNIHLGRDAHGMLDLDRTAAAIRAQGAELVALQEVGRHWSAETGFRDQAADLGQLLGMQPVFGANLDRAPYEPGAPRRQYGTAVLSSWPIVASEHILLPRASSVTEQRGLLVVDVARDGARFRLHNAHLSVSSQDRELQVAAILAETDEATVPHALAGDFNARPTAPELAPLFDRFRDAWTLAGDGQGFTFPASGPNARLDYVLVSSDVAVTAVRVPVVAGSDHLPVIADLDLAQS
jgi:endonuclease/exonuclease/phosphatase family metal-dependent hydrolase